MAQQIGGSTVTYNGAIPMGGPVAISTVIEIDGNDVLVDLKLDYATGKISGVQTLYIDLRDFLGDVTVTMPDTGQRITARAGTQGYYPVLSTNLMKFIVSATIDGKFPVNFINFPIALGVWPSGVKGDKGDPGEPGPAGGTVVVEDSGAVFGYSLLDTTSEPGKILVKRISGGSGITVTDYGDEIEIEAEGGGGGGDGTTDYLEIMLSQNMGGPGEIAANSFVNLDLSGGLAVGRKGTALNNTADGISIAAGNSGLYAVTLNLSAPGISTGEFALRVNFQSHNRFIQVPAGTLVRGGVLSCNMVLNVLGVPTLDVLKFAVCNTENAMTNYIINATVAKIG